MTVVRTNARSFVPNFKGLRRAALSVRIKAQARRFYRHCLRHELDDFDWSTYHLSYGAQNEIEARNYTYDLDEVEYRLIDGRIYTIGDAKPINAEHRAVFEAILNLPDIESVHEIGTGGGKLIVNLGKLLRTSCLLGASDLGAAQLALFERNWSRQYALVKPFVHDITEFPLPESARADVVFTATVLMHIQREGAYRAALRHLLMSAHKFVVLVENWNVHDYVADILDAASDCLSLPQVRLGLFDSGAATAMVVAIGDASFGAEYSRLESTVQLCKYAS